MDLVVELNPPEAAARQQLEQRLAAELRARDLDVCAAGAGERSLAQVRVSAPLPELSPTWVTVRTESGPALERNLDIAALPAEARPSAIASATDELLSSSLLSSSLQSAVAPPATTITATAATADTTGATAEAEPEPAWQLPRLELGLGGGGALFGNDQRAFRGELLGRWRPLSRLFTTLRVGGDRRLTGETPWFVQDLEFRIVDRASGWHIGLDAGFELIEPAQGFGVAAVAGLAVARLERTQDWDVGTLSDPAAFTRSTDSSWELASNVGAEVSYRGRGWGVDLALSLLLPLSRRERSSQPETPQLMEQSDQYQVWDVSSTIQVPPGAGFGEQLGGQLDLRLWLALGS